jgi:hypothetical protein
LLPLPLPPIFTVHATSIKLRSSINRYSHFGADPNLTLPLRASHLNLARYSSIGFEYFMILRHNPSERLGHNLRKSRLGMLFQLFYMRISIAPHRSTEQLNS